jgi:hypothetical protein
MWISSPGFSRSWRRTGSTGAPSDQLQPHSKSPNGDPGELILFVVLGALAHAEVGQFDDAWRSIDEALTLIEKTSLGVLLCTLIGCPGHSPSAYCSGTGPDLVHQGGGPKSGASNAGAPLDRRGELSKRPAVSHLFSRARWRGYRIVQRARIAQALGDDCELFGSCAPPGPAIFPVRGQPRKYASISPQVMRGQEEFCPHSSFEGRFFRTHGRTRGF